MPSAIPRDDDPHENGWDHHVEHHSEEAKISVGDHAIDAASIRLSVFPFGVIGKVS
jgi:hypothetical protein